MWNLYILPVVDWIINIRRYKIDENFLPSVVLLLFFFSIEEQQTHEKRTMEIISTPDTSNTTTTTNYSTYFGTIFHE